MIHPDTELRYKNADVGNGVFATRAIPAGTIVWALCPLDRRLTPVERAALAPASRDLVDLYAYVDAAGDFILCWDHGRFVNHSCQPAMVGLGPDMEVAVRDLAPGDELSCDYGSLNLLQPLACRCGAAACRGQIGASDLLRIAGELDNAAAQVLPRIGQVPQPLMPFVRDAGLLSDWLAGVAQPPSSRSYLFDAP